MFVSFLIKFQIFLIKHEGHFCEKLLKKYENIFMLLNKIMPKNPNKMVFFGWPDFTGNSMALYKYLLKNRSYELLWINGEPYTKSNQVKDCSLFYTYRTIYNMLTAGWVFVSNIMHVNLYKLLGNKKQHFVNLWHGMPIKALLNMHLNSKISLGAKKNIKEIIDKKTFLPCALSEFWQCVLCACFLADKEFVPITGQPRNDYIIQNNSKSGLNCICDTEKYNKIILYAPTFCKHNDNCAKNDFRLIQLPNFDIEAFNNYLKENNILMIVKLHPVEEAAYQEHLQEYSNIKIINYLELQTKDVEFDYILGCFDMLITDYSSIYVDYLLANKPILFLKQNYEEYNDKRGFIMGENYDYFCPGPMINNFDELKSSLIDELKHDNYKDKREKVLKLFHKYTDGKASERVCKYLNI